LGLFFAPKKGLSRRDDPIVARHEFLFSVIPNRLVVDLVLVIEVRGREPTFANR